MDMNSNSNNVESKSKNKKIIIIIAAVAVFLSCSCCCCGSLFLLGSDSKKDDSESSNVIETKSESSEPNENLTTNDTKKETTTLISTTTSTSNDKSAETSENVTSDTTTSVQLELTQLYIDFFEPYVDSIAKLSPQAFKQVNKKKFADYDVEIIEGNEDDLWNFKITDSNNNHITLWFFPDNDVYTNPPDDWNWTLYLLTYSDGNKEISITDETHTEKAPKYKTHDKNREKINQEVESIDELKEFMFINK